MTIEEVIAHEKFKAKVNRIKADKGIFPNNSEYDIFTCNRSAEELEKIVEWLEELKQYKDTLLTPKMIKELKKSENRRTKQQNT